MFMVDFVLTILNVCDRSRTTMLIYVKNATSYIDVGDGCWSLMLETKCVDDKFKMSVID